MEKTKSPGNPYELSGLMIGQESVSSRAVGTATARPTAIAWSTALALAFALTLSITGAAVSLLAFFLAGGAFLVGFRWSAVSGSAAALGALG